MRRFQPIFIFFSLVVIGLLSACSGEPPQEKAILGTWVQESPFSITDRGLQTTTTDTVLRLMKNGETHLTRNLDIIGKGLPKAGIQVSVELRGNWELINGELKQTPDSVLILPRGSDKESRKWAVKLQAQAEENGPSVKSIISADKSQLILQDAATGTTDVYVRQ